MLCPVVSFEKRLRRQLFYAGSQNGHSEKEAGAPTRLDCSPSTELKTQSFRVGLASYYNVCWILVGEVDFSQSERAQELLTLEPPAQKHILDH